MMWVSFYWPQIGGVETFTRQLARALKARGHHVCIVAAHGHLQLPDVTDDNGIAVHRFPFWEAIEQRDPGLILRVQKRLAALKRDFAPDLIHLNCLDASTFFHLRSANIAPAPTVVTLHWTPPAEVWNESGVIGQTLRQADWIAAISTHQIEIINGTLPERSAHTSLFLNGLDVPALPPSPVPSGCQQIFCIGRLVNDKGFDIAIDAFAQMAGNFPDAQLVIAGDGVERSALMQRAVDAGVSHRTQFVGWIPHDEVAAAIAQSVMVVMPSRFEPFGLVAVEAGQMERPIVATSVGGLPDIVVDNETGLLVPANNVTALSAAMTRLMREPATVARMGLAGRQRATTLFSAQRNSTMYETLFQQLTEENANVVAG